MSEERRLSIDESMEELRKLFAPRSEETPLAPQEPPPKQSPPEASPVNSDVLADDKGYIDGPWIVHTDKGVRIIPQLLSMYLKEKYIFLVIGNKAVKDTLLFLYKDGYYHLLDEFECANFIYDFLPPEHRLPSHWRNVHQELQIQRSNVKRSDLNPEHLINFNNGVLDLNTGKLMEHSPSIYMTTKIPCDYVPCKSRNDAPTFKGFLDDLTQCDRDVQKLLFEYIGAIISNVHGYRFKKMLILYGKGDTGKSVLRDFVIELIGRENSHSIDLKDLNNRFGTSQIFGKRLAGAGDLAFAAIPELDKVKELTGGDDLNAEYKGKDGFSYKYTGFLWYNTNQLPTFRGDTGKHVFQRLLVVPCNNVIPEERQDKNLVSKLLQEKEAIIYLCICHLRNVLQRGYLFTEGEVVKTARANYMNENNSLLRFVHERCTLNEGSTKRSTFNRSYKLWCMCKGVASERHGNIESKLSEAFGISAYKNGEIYYPLTINPEQD